MKRKALLVSSIILSFALVYGLFYEGQYSIEAEEKAIHTSLAEWQNRGSAAVFEFHILEMIQIDQTHSHIILFETPDTDIGYAHLVKGMNGKLKIIQSGWGDNLASYTDIKTNKGMYGLLVGKNPDLEIDYITAESGNEEFGFTSTVSNAETYIRYEKLPKKLKQTFLPYITLYDKNGKIINPLRKEGY